MRSLNPGYKLLTLILASLVLSLTYHTRLNLLTAAVALTVTVCTPRVNRRGLLLAMVPFLLTAAGMFTTGLFFSQGGGQALQVSLLGQRTLYATSLESGLQLASRVLAFGGIGMLFAFTTQSMDLIMSLMQQFRLPPKFAYGILAAYHFFPVIRSEYDIVGAALQVRGVKAGPFSPKRLFPMLVHALERSESLAMAMESRGFEDGAPRSVAFRIPLRWVDFLFLLGVPAGLTAGLFLL
ncbi:MAG: energy-coupling factor transporter transmembrane component T [Oscillospiraceae bacterium]